MLDLNILGFSSTEAIAVIKPLLLFIIGMAIYSIFVFKFYQFLARKDIFRVDLQKYADSFVGNIQRFFSLILYAIQYLLLFPLFIFFWFSVLTLIIAFLSKNQDLSNIMLVSMALVATVRITAYYKEDLSKDLAKMLPFALLGVFLIDISFFSFETSIVTLKSVVSLWKNLIYYFVFTVLLEFTLRISNRLIRLVLRRETNQEVIEEPTISKKQPKKSR